MNYHRKGTCLAVMFLFVGAGVVSNVTGVDSHHEALIYVNGNSCSGGIIYVDDDYNSSTPGWGIDHFDNIQNGINAASENDTVLVYGGVYNETVLVNKTINLTGMDKLTTIIDGGENDDVVYVSADWVNLSGFTIKNGAPSGNYGGDGIHLHSNCSNIFDNIFISNSKHGIFMAPCDNNIVSGNIISNSQTGIYVSDSGGHRIVDNIIYSNDDSGIYLHQSSGNIIFGNNISQNGAFGGIYLGADSDGNIIADNHLRDNVYGIRSIYAINNIIYHNNFVSNDCNAIDDGDNIWYWPNCTEGNFWDDYTGVDSNGDGIGDTPYDISGGDNKDLYPFIEETGWLRLPVADFGWSPKYPGINESVTFNASGSSDEDGSIELYEWDFDNDGEYEKTGIIVTYFWSNSGAYQVTLKVTDDEGLADTVTRTVYVKPPALSIDLISGGFARISVKISNNWDMTVEDISCYIDVNGGIFGKIDVKSSGAAPHLEFGDEIIFYTDKPIFGFGSIDIQVTVNADNAESIICGAKGFVLGSFVSVLF